MSLHQHAYAGHYDECKNILENTSVDVNYVDSEGNTPLMSAIIGTQRDMYDPQILNEQYNICKLLLDHNASTNDVNGYTPLMIAAEQFLTNICTLLIERGSRVNKRNNQGQTALIILSELDTSYADNDLIDTLRTNTARVLIDSGAQVNTRDSYGNTPLHYATANRQFELCELLIERNANVNILNNHSHTPLFFAARGIHTAMCQFLIRNGAIVNMDIINAVRGDENLKNYLMQFMFPQPLTNHITDISPSTEECAICYNKLNEPNGQDLSDINPVKLNTCSHEFHKSCILQWKNTHPPQAEGKISCPLCRQLSYGKSKRKPGKKSIKKKSKKFTKIFYM